MQRSVQSQLAVAVKQSDDVSMMHHENPGMGAVWH